MDVGKKLFDIKDRQMYNKINIGVGKYWVGPWGDKLNKKYGLCSRNYLYTSIENDSHKYITIALKDIFKSNYNNKTIRSSLMCLIVARFGRFYPYPYLLISEHTNLSVSTIKRLIGYNKDIKTYKNICVITQTRNLSRAMYIKQKLNSQHAMIINIHNKWYIYKVMPNSYEVPFEIHGMPKHNYLCDEDIIYDKYVFSENIQTNNENLNVWKLCKHAIINK